MEAGPSENVNAETKKIVPKSVWLLKIEGSTIVSGSEEPLEHFFSGVCIAKDGLILTCSEGLSQRGYREGLTVSLQKDMVYGRTRNSEFKILELRWEDTRSSLRIYKVKDDVETSDYDYVDVSKVKVDRDSELACVGINVDQPFSRFELHVLAPIGHHAVGRYGTPQEGFKYLPLYGKLFNEDFHNFDASSVMSTMAGSPVFDECGLLVALLSLPFATPVNAKVIKRYKRAQAD